MVALHSPIEWTSATWNPVTGCTKVSPGCAHCYAETMAKRLKAMGNPRYAHGFEVHLHEDMLDLPLSWKRPRMIFVNSMSDLFHEAIPFSFIEKVFGTIERANWHTFQILTKRAERMAELAPHLHWPENLWMGVTVECQECADRIDYLRTVPAAVRFVSAEPLLGPLDIDLDGIDWLIVGGESGPRARPMDREWARALRYQCLREGIPFFFKQWGGFNKKRNGRLLDERTWDELPGGSDRAQLALIA